MRLFALFRTCLRVVQVVGKQEVYSKGILNTGQLSFAIHLLRVKEIKRTLKPDCAIVVSCFTTRRPIDSSGSFMAPVYP